MIICAVILLSILRIASGSAYVNSAADPDGTGTWSVFGIAGLPTGDKTASYFLATPSSFSRSDVKFSNLYDLEGPRKGSRYIARRSEGLNGALLRNAVIADQQLDVIFAVGCPPGFEFHIAAVFHVGVSDSRGGALEDFASRLVALHGGSASDQPVAVDVIQSHCLQLSGVLSYYSPSWNATCLGGTTKLLPPMFDAIDHPLETVENHGAPYWRVKETDPFVENGTSYASVPLFSTSTKGYLERGSPTLQANGYFLIGKLVRTSAPLMSLPPSHPNSWLVGIGSRMDDHCAFYSGDAYDITPPIVVARERQGGVALLGTAYHHAQANNLQVMSEKVFKPFYKAGAMAQTLEVLLPHLAYPRDVEALADCGHLSIRCSGDPPVLTAVSLVLNSPDVFVPVASILRDQLTRPAHIPPFAFDMGFGGPYLLNSADLLSNFICSSPVAELIGYFDVGPWKRYSSVLDLSNCTLPRLRALLLSAATPEMTSIVGINSFPALEVLDLKGHAPKVDQVKGFCALSSLRVFNLHQLNEQAMPYSSLELPGFRPDCQFVNITNFDVHGTGFYGTLPEELSTRSLVNLDISSTNVAGTLPSNFNLLRDSLRSLYMRDMPNFTGNLPQLQDFAYICGIAFQGTAWRGTLPESIFSSPRCSVVLVIDSPYITGVLPNHFSQSVYLREITIFGTQITGPLLDFNDKMHNVHFLNLSNNRLTDVWDTWEIFREVHFLDLSRNRLAGTLPRWSYNFAYSEASIVTVNLSRNFLSGLLPGHFHCLHTLSVFDVSHNRFSGHVAQPRHVTESYLRNYFQSNDLVRFFPFNETKVNEEYMNLFESPDGVTSSFFSPCPPNPKLTTNSTTCPTFTYNKLCSFLDLSHNRFVGGIPIAELILSQCYDVDVSDNHFTQFDSPFIWAFMPELSVLLISGSALKRLRISNLPLQGSLDSMLGAFSTIVDGLLSRLKDFALLEFLDASNSSLRIGTEVGLFTKFFRDFLQPNSMIISNNYLPNIELHKFLNLERFYCANCFLGGQLPSVDFGNQTHLDLSHNEFVGTVPNLSPSLVYLDLRHNQLEGDIFSSVARSAGSLRHLLASNNLFSGTLKQSVVESMCQLRSLSLASNRLTGKLPYFRLGPPCSGLSLLQLVDLSHNEFSIHDTSSLFFHPEPWILPVFKGLLSLAVLNLSYNRIDGGGSYGFFEGIMLPYFNVSLPSLSVLDISHNQIEGTLVLPYRNLSTAVVPSDYLVFNQFCQSDNPGSLIVTGNRWACAGIMSLSLPNINTDIGNDPCEELKPRIVTLLKDSATLDSIGNYLFPYRWLARADLAYNYSTRGSWTSHNSSSPQSSDIVTMISKHIFGTDFVRFPLAATYLWAKSLQATAAAGVSIAKPIADPTLVKLPSDLHDFPPIGFILSASCGGYRDSLTATAMSAFVDVTGTAYVFGDIVVVAKASGSSDLEKYEASFATPTAITFSNFDEFGSCSSMPNPPTFVSVSVAGSYGLFLSSDGAVWGVGSVISSLSWRNSSDSLCNIALSGPEHLRNGTGIVCDQDSIAAVSVLSADDFAAPEVALRKGDSIVAITATHAFATAISRDGVALVFGNPECMLFKSPPCGRIWPPCIVNIDKYLRVNGFGVFDVQPYLDTSFIGSTIYGISSSSSRGRYSAMITSSGGIAIFVGESQYPPRHFIVDSQFATHSAISVFDNYENRVSPDEQFNRDRPSAFVLTSNGDLLWIPLALYEPPSSEQFILVALTNASSPNCIKVPSYPVDRLSDIVRPTPNPSTISIFFGHGDFAERLTSTALAYGSPSLPAACVTKCGNRRILAATYVHSRLGQLILVCVCRRSAPPSPSDVGPWPFGNRTDMYFTFAQVFADSTKFKPAVGGHVITSICDSPSHSLITTTSCIRVHRPLASPKLQRNELDSTRFNCGQRLGNPYIDGKSVQAGIISLGPYNSLDASLRNPGSVALYPGEAVVVDIGTCPRVRSPKGVQLLQDAVPISNCKTLLQDFQQEFIDVQDASVRGQYSKADFVLMECVDELPPDMTMSLSGIGGSPISILRHRMTANVVEQPVLGGFYPISYHSPLDLFNFQVNSSIPYPSAAGISSNAPLCDAYPQVPMLINVAVNASSSIFADSSSRTGRHLRVMAAPSGANESPLLFIDVAPGAPVAFNVRQSTNLSLILNRRRFARKYIGYLEPSLLLDDPIVVNILDVAGNLVSPISMGYLDVIAAAIAGKQNKTMMDEPLRACVRFRYLPASTSVPDSCTNTSSFFGNPCICDELADICDSEFFWSTLDSPSFLSPLLPLHVRTASGNYCHVVPSNFDRIFLHVEPVATAFLQPFCSTPLLLSGCKLDEFYAYDAQDHTWSCRICPPGFQCDGTTSYRTVDGFWHASYALQVSAPDSLQTFLVSNDWEGDRCFHSTDSSLSCKLRQNYGGNATVESAYCGLDLVCELGNCGPLCGLCTDRWVSDRPGTSQCVKCENISILLAMTQMLVIFLVCLLATWLHLRSVQRHERLVHSLESGATSVDLGDLGIVTRDYVMPRGLGAILFSQRYLAGFFCKLAITYLQTVSTLSSSVGHSLESNCKMSNYLGELSYALCRARQLQRSAMSGVSSLMTYMSSRHVWCLFSLMNIRVSLLLRLVATSLFFIMLLAVVIGLVFFKRNQHLKKRKGGSVQSSNLSSSFLLEPASMGTVSQLSDLSSVSEEVTPRLTPKSDKSMPEKHSFAKLVSVRAKSFTTSVATSAKRITKVPNFIIGLAITCCYLLYPTVLGTVVQVFVCVPVASIAGLSVPELNRLGIRTDRPWSRPGETPSVLLADTGVFCDSAISPYREIYAIGIVVVILLVLGFPFGLYYVLQRSNQKGYLFTDIRMLTRLGFLFKGYRPQFFYWETLVMMRKAALLFAATLSSVEYQFSVMAWVIIIELTLTIMFKPYNRRGQSLSVVMLIVLLLQINSNIVYSSSSADSFRLALTITTTFMSVFVVLQLVLYAGSEYIQSQREDLTISLLSRIILFFAIPIEKVVIFVARLPVLVYKFIRKQLERIGIVRHIHHDSQFVSREVIEAAIFGKHRLPDLDVSDVISVLHCVPVSRREIWKSLPRETSNTAGDSSASLSQTPSIPDLRQYHAALSSVKRRLDYMQRQSHWLARTHTSIISAVSHK